MSWISNFFSRFFPTQKNKADATLQHEDHVLIVGWSPKIFAIITECLLENKNSQRASIISIVAEKEIAMMEAEVKEKIPTIQSSDITYYTGSMTDRLTIDAVNPSLARSIIILSATTSPNISMVDAVLGALTNEPLLCRTTPCRVIVQLQDATSCATLRKIGLQDCIPPLPINEIMTGAISQVITKANSAFVYVELMSDTFQIYFKQEPSLTGKTYREAMQMFQQIPLMGICKADGTIIINPSLNTIIESTDQIFPVVDESIFLSTAPLQLTENSSQNLQKILILGWNTAGAKLISECEKVVLPGSEVMVMADTPNLENEIIIINEKFINLTINFQSSNNIDYHTLYEEFDRVAYDYIFVLADDQLDAKVADTNTLAILKDIQTAYG